MHLDSPLALDSRPPSSELLHHLLPDKEGLVSDLLNSCLRFLLKHVKTEVALDDCGFSHEELEISVGHT